MILGIIGAIISVIATAASYTQAKKAQKAAQKAADSAQGVLISSHNNNAGLKIIYGERAVGVTKVWKGTGRNSVIPAGGRQVIGKNSTSADATKNFDYDVWLDRVDVIGLGPIDAVTDVQIDGDSYNNSRFGNQGLSHFRAIVMDGSPGQTALTELSSVHPGWRTSAVGNEIAYINSRFRHAEEFQFSGEPDVVVTAKGRRVYDPRDVAQSAVDDTTWLWSDNPALCLLDYLTQPYGRNLDIAQLDIPSFIAAANQCEVQVAVPDRLTNTTGTTIPYYDYRTGVLTNIVPNATLPNYRPYQTAATQNRLRCNLVVDPTNDVLTNVESLLDTMKASLPYDQGVYSLKLADSESSVMSLDETDVLPGIKFGNGDQSDRLNRLTVKFPNKNKRYKEDEVSWPKLSSVQYTTYLNDDNGLELHQTIELKGVTDYYQAEDICEYIVRDSRSSLECEVTVKSKALRLQPGDVIDLTHSTPNWVAKKFRISGIKRNRDLTVTLSLREYQESVYQWNPKSAEPDQPDVNLPDPYSKPAVLANVSSSVTSVLNATGVTVGRVEVAWDAPAEQVTEFIVQYRQSGASTWLFTRAARDDTDVAFIAPSDGVDIDIEVYYRNSSGVFSDKAALTQAVPVYELTVNGVNASTITSSLSSAIQLASNASQLAGTKVTTYFSNDAPTGVTLVDGDLWVDEDAGTPTGGYPLYRWDAAGSTWRLLLETQTAIVKADNAQATADSKIVTFYEDEAPVPEGVGDIWFDTNDSNKEYRYNINGFWVSVQDGSIAFAQLTANDALNDAGQAIFDAAGALGVANGKVTTYYSNTDPQLDPANPAMTEGDLWIDQDDQNKLYRFDSSVPGWAIAQDQKIPAALLAAGEAQDTADGKIVSFFTLSTAPPTGPYALGDLWYQIDTDFVKRWNGTDWGTNFATVGAPAGTSVGGVPAGNVVNPPRNLVTDTDFNGAYGSWDYQYGSSVLPAPYMWFLNRNSTKGKFLSLYGNASDGFFATPLTTQVTQRIEYWVPAEAGQTFLISSALRMHQYVSGAAKLEVVFRQGDKSTLAGVATGATVTSSTNDFETVSGSVVAPSGTAWAALRWSLESLVIAQTGSPGPSFDICDMYISATTETIVPQDPGNSGPPPNIVADPVIDTGLPDPATVPENTQFTDPVLGLQYTLRNGSWVLTSSIGAPAGTTVSPTAVPINAVTQHTPVTTDVILDPTFEKTRLNTDTNIIYWDSQ
jgi:hypothetical protein